MKYRNCKIKKKMAVLQDASLKKKKNCNKKVRVCLITFFQWKKKKNLITRWNSEKKSELNVNCSNEFTCDYKILTCNCEEKSLICEILIFNCEKKCLDCEIKSHNYILNLIKIKILRQEKYNTRCQLAITTL